MNKSTDAVRHGDKDASPESESQPEPAQIERAKAVVLEIAPLYPDPEYACLDEFLDTDEHQALSRANGPVVQVARRTLDAAMFDANARWRVEVGGLCLGYTFRNRDDERLLIRVERMIRAEHTLAGATHLTFTYETWRELIIVHTRSFPDMRVLGWYHSHPGLGIFLSSIDRFTHNSFFGAPWHVAVVIDPLPHKVGIFARCAGDLLALDALEHTDTFGFTNRQS